jgi:hypothetical protein
MAETRNISAVVAANWECPGSHRAETPVTSPIKHINSLLKKKKTKRNDPKNVVFFLQIMQFSSTFYFNASDCVKIC